MQQQILKSSQQLYCAPSQICLKTWQKMSKLMTSLCIMSNLSLNSNNKYQGNWLPCASGQMCLENKSSQCASLCIKSNLPWKSTTNQSSQWLHCPSHQIWLDTSREYQSQCSSLWIKANWTENTQLCVHKLLGKSEANTTTAPHTLSLRHKHPYHSLAVYWFQSFRSSTQTLE